MSPIRDASSYSPSSTDLGISLLRFSLGVMWMAHALLKLLVFTLPGTAGFFASVGLPGWLAYPVFAVELLGGLAIAVGLYARQLSLLLMPILLGAVWVHLPNGWVHTSAGGGWEYPLFLCVSSLALWLLGDGAVAIRRSSWLVPRPAAA
ncbi:DoxX family protein [Pelomonas sp. V22]|uniref:DoxX family protein n=1 Tax=Pelomonas sp. V22 TaxID=2822139 RepID=UPI0024A9E6C4|nr:DoxX family protein [Pelomonas sp. V22]